MKKVRVALIGAGQRGMECYAPYVLNHPDEMEFVAVAEPNEERRKKFSEKYNIPQNMQFESWEKLLDKSKLCEGLIIATQDDMHFEVTMSALDKGYDILLEKPISNKVDNCINIVNKAEEKNRFLMICHVLRYTPFLLTLKKIIDDGSIGEIVSIQHNENVGFWHQSHSFVRGNWRNSKESSPMILQKSCHDMDLLNWLIGKKCINISSFGSLSFFKKENAPKGSTIRCTDGCKVEKECPYSSYKYTEDRPYREIFKTVVCDDNREEAFLDAIKEGPYGRCVYHCDNDVVDHQVVNMEYENGVTVAFTMCAFTTEGSRTIKVMGTKGDIRGVFEKDEIEVGDFLTGKVKKIKVNGNGTMHGGGDEGIMSSFSKALRLSDKDSMTTSASISLDSHIMAFAAEKSRLEKRVINLEDYKDEFR